MATKTSTVEGVLPLLHAYGSQQLWTWRSIILSFGYVPRSMSIPLQIRDSFLSTFSWTLSYFKVKLTSLSFSYRVSFPFPHMQWKELWELLLWPPSDLSSAPGPPKPAHRQRQVLIQLSALCYAWLIQFTINLSFTSIYSLYCCLLFQVKIKFLEPF